MSHSPSQSEVRPDEHVVAADAPEHLQFGSIDTTQMDSSSIDAAASSYRQSILSAGGHAPENDRDPVETANEQLLLDAEEQETSHGLDTPRPSPVSAEEGEEMEAIITRNISDISYFSPSLRRDASEIAEQDVEALVRMMRERLLDTDADSMRALGEEFQRLQDAIVEMSMNPSVDSFHEFQAALERFFILADQYATTHPAPSGRLTGETERRAIVDTDIERSTIGMWLRFLIAELKELKSTIAPLSSVASKEEWAHDRAVIRPSVAQLAGPKVYSMDRQSEMEKYIVKAEALLGEKGLKLTGASEKGRSLVGRVLAMPANAVTYRIGDIRNQILRYVLAGALAAGATGTAMYQGVQWLRGGNAAEEAPKDPKPNVAKTPEQVMQDEVEKMFAGMSTRIENGKLHVRFSDLGKYKVNDTLAIHVGEGGKVHAKNFNEENGEYVYHLSQSERLTGTELSVGIQAEVADRLWFYPMDANKKPVFKTVQGS